MEEFGGCTAQPGEASHMMKWESHGQPREIFMASEEDLAEFLRQTLPKLHDTGAVGAMIWCYADYIPELWHLPPCDEAKHERFFGLVRPDGSLKPHARVIKEFAATYPKVKPIPDHAKITVNADEYYTNPESHLVDLYRQYLKSVEVL
jgi:endo-1,4-beta-mannosidase